MTQVKKIKTFLGSRMNPDKHGIYKNRQPILGDPYSFPALMHLKRQFLCTRSLQNFPEPFPVLAVLLVVIQAPVNHLQDFLLAENSRQFLGQPGMAAQFAADLDPEASLLLLQSSGRAGGYALAARHAFLPVDDRPIPRQNDGPLPAGLHASAAPNAFFRGDLRPASSDQSDVGNLGTGASVGAVGDADPELMVSFKGPPTRDLKKTFKFLFARSSSIFLARSS